MDNKIRVKEEEKTDLHVRIGANDSANKENLLQQTKKLQQKSH